MDIVKEKSVKILEAVRGAKKILLHLHPSPDPDSIGSALSVYHVLLGLGKDVSVIAGDSPLPVSLSFLPGFEKIVEKNFFEIEQSDFDLFIILDSSNAGMVSKKDEVKFPETMKTIVIDHHPSNDQYGSINLVDEKSPATAEILFRLFKEWQVELTPDIALCLFIGIYGDTGGFRYPKTTDQTFLIVSELVRLYPEFPAVLALMNSQNTPGQLAYRALAYGQIEVLGNGQAALVSISNEKISDKKFTDEDMSNAQIPNNLISVKDWVLGISLVEKKPGQIFLSMRCRDRHLDVSLLATKLGGGGHLGAAGAMIEGDFTQAKKDLEKLLREFYPELF